MALCLHGRDNPEPRIEDCRNRVHARQASLETGGGTWKKVNLICQKGLRTLLNI